MSTAQTSNAMVPAEAAIRRLLTLRLIQSRESQCPRFVVLIMPNCTRRVEYFQCRIRWVRTGDARWPGYQVSPPLRVAVGANVCNWAVLVRPSLRRMFSRCLRTVKSLR